MAGGAGVRAMTETGGLVRRISSGMGDGRAAQRVVTKATTRERNESFISMSLKGLEAGC